ncbi:MAG: RDD family protein [Bacteroidia bacterium]|nr:RDD family protein [Bacteroidia bacterium]
MDKSKLVYLLKRSLAYWIDCIIAFAIVMLFIQQLILVKIRGYIGIDKDWFQDAWNMEIYVLLSISLPVWLYFAFQDSSTKKGSLGKKWMKLAVTQLENGKKLSFAKALSRTLLKLLPWEIAHLGIIFPEPMYFAEDPQIRILSILGILLFLVYFLSISLNQKQQSLYDKWLNTHVHFYE